MQCAIKYHLQAERYKPFKPTCTGDKLPLIQNWHLKN